MGRRTATITLEGDGVRFVAETGSGHRIVLDNAEGDAGPRPAELVAVAVAGCTAMDVISILRKKQQVVTGYRVEAAGLQRDESHPHVFTRFDVTHIVEGPDLSVEAVRRSIELSATRYCSVGGTLSSGITEIRHRYLVRTRGVELAGEAILTGPYEHPDALGLHVVPLSA